MTTFDRWFIHSSYDTRSTRDLARLIAGIALLMIVLLAIFELQSLLRGVNPLTRSALNGSPVATAFVIGVFGGGALTLVATRRGWTTVSQVGPIIMWSISGVLLGVQTGFASATDLASLIILLIIGFVTMRERGVGITLVTGLILLFIGLDRRSLLTLPPNAPNTATTLTNNTILMVGTSIILLLYLRNASYEREDSRAKAESDRLKLATMTTDIARQISSQTALDELLTSTVEEIRSRYDQIYHTQIFLIDEFGVSAKLVASTGDVGKMLLSRGHQLEVGSVSVIGSVTRTGKAVIARAGASDGIHRRNELLPETQVEAALPLLVGGRVIGALDMQSRDVKAFTDEDLPIFQSLADSTAVAIENARLFEQTQARLVENQRLLDQMGTAIREIERLNRELTGQSWSEYLGDYVKTPSLDVNFKTNVTERNMDWTPTLRQALNTDETVQERRGDVSIIAVPIRVRGQVIGAMEFELDDLNPMSESAGLAQSVGERFGLALENTRLYEETQRAASREQRVNSIAAQYQDVTTVDELLRITVSELGGILGAEKASIRLGGIGMNGQDNGNGARSSTTSSNGRAKR